MTAGISTATTTSATAPGVSGRLRRFRAPLIIGAISVLVLLATVLISGRVPTGSLDPTAVDPSGSRAVANLLSAQGVSVQRVATARDARDALTASGGQATLFVTLPQAVSAGMASVLQDQSIAHVVLVGPLFDDLPGPFPSSTITVGETSTGVTDPGCASPAATRAGRASAGGTTYSASGTSCYGDSVVDIVGADRPGQVTGSVTMVGAPDVFTNAALADEGNASLAMSILGRDPVLVWWIPSASDPASANGGGATVTATDLLPSWVSWVALQLLVATFVVAVARGRRLGRVVSEDLPVTVRAAETTEGLARLYQRAGARGHAARRLAASATDRLRSALHLGDADVAEIAAVAAHHVGHDPTATMALLTPADPLDDRALVNVLDRLDSLERKVRRP